MRAYGFFLFVLSEISPEYYRIIIEQARKSILSLKEKIIINETCKNIIMILTIII